MTANKIFLFFASVVAIGYFSYQISVTLNGSDFSVFYCAAKIALDPVIPSSRVYDTSALLSCNVPEVVTHEYRKALHFIYSLPAAYLLSPLALLPYFYSKALVIFVDILSYVIAFQLLLKNVLPDKHSIKSPKYLLLAPLWLPFHCDIEYAQINSAIFLFIVIAAIKASKTPSLSGFLLGVVSLFKLFPLGIALLLGLKNWRVAASCLLTVIISLAITDSWSWFTAIGNISSFGKTPVYSIIEFNNYLYIFYVIFIAGITAFVIFFGNFDDFFIISFGITAIFVIMPIIEYHHLVLLIAPLLYIKI